MHLNRQPFTQFSTKHENFCKLLHQVTNMYTCDMARQKFPRFGLSSKDTNLLRRCNPIDWLPVQVTLTYQLVLFSYVFYEFSSIICLSPAIRLVTRGLCFTLDFSEYTKHTLSITFNYTN